MTYSTEYEVLFLTTFHDGSYVSEIEPDPSNPKTAAKHLIHILRDGREDLSFEDREYSHTFDVLGDPEAEKTYNAAWNAKIEIGLAKGNAFEKHFGYSITDYYRKKERSFDQLLSDIRRRNKKRKGREVVAAAEKWALAPTVGEQAQALEDMRGIIAQYITLPGI